MKVNFTPLKLLVVSLLLTQFVMAQSVGDYESTGSGDWDNSATWERWNGSAWITPAAAPTSADGVITILSGHTVTLANASVTADQIVVAAGANLNVNVFPYSLTLDDGPGDDLVVNGTFLLRGTNTLGSSSSSVTAVINGTMNWFSGVLQAPTTISGSGTMNLDLDFQKDLSANLTNNGTFNFGTGPTTGGIFFNNATFTNNGTLNEIFQSDRGFFPNSGTNAFVNNGTFNKTTTFVFGNFGVPFTNTGTLKGIGTYNLTGTVNNTGTISPGSSPGILGTTSAALTGSPTINIEIINNGGAGSGHDRLDFNTAFPIDVSGTTLIVTEIPATVPLGIYTIMDNTAGGGAFTNNFAAVVIPGGYTLNYTPGTSTSITVTKAFVTLPAVWGDFSALVKNNNQVNLKWTTLQENNVSNYTVEYSMNGRDYKTIGTVAAAGNTNSATTYTFNHTNPDLQKTNFYRIRQADMDGKSAYSITRQVKFTKGVLVPVTVTPNPASDRLQLSVQANNIRAMLVDISGRTLKILNLQAGNHDLDISLLAPGMYQLVIFQDGQRVETQKIIKQ